MEVVGLIQVRDIRRNGKFLQVISFQLYRCEREVGLVCSQVVGWDQNLEVFIVRINREIYDFREQGYWVEGGELDCDKKEIKGEEE